VSPKKKQLIWVLVVFAIVVTVDQVTKSIVMWATPNTETAYRLDHPKFFRISHQRNPGLVGGLFDGNPWIARSAPLAACCVLIYLFTYLDPRSKLQTLAYGCIAGGAVGNQIDRFRLGSVTDFLQFHFYFIPFDFPWKYYPAFNVADSAICCGVFVLIITWYIMGKSDAARTV